MCTLIAAFLFAELASVAAQQPSPSEVLKERFLAILRQQVTAMMNEAASQARLASQDEVVRVIESVMKEVQANYGPLLTLPEAEADQLLTTGPNGKTNLEAIQRDIELWKKVKRPMPVLLKRMQDEVAFGKITSGLELELTRRISEFHLQELGMLNPSTTQPR